MINDVASKSNITWVLLFGESYQSLHLITFGGERPKVSATCSRRPDRVQEKWRLCLPSRSQDNYVIRNQNHCVTILLPEEKDNRKERITVERGEVICVWIVDPIISPGQASSYRHVFHQWRQSSQRRRSGVGWRHRVLLCVEMSGWPNPVLSRNLKNDTNKVPLGWLFSMSYIFSIFLLCASWASDLTENYFSLLCRNCQQ